MPCHDDDDPPLSSRPARIFWAVLDPLHLDRVAAWCFGMLRVAAVPLTYPLAAFVGFVSAIYRTRSRRLLWLTGPVLAVAAGLAYVVYSVQSQDRGRIQRRYTTALNEAIESKDFSAAALYQQKLRQLGASVDRHELQKAEQMLTAGEPAKAIEAVRQLATQEKLGLRVAHLWLAKKLLDLTPQQRDALRMTSQAAAHEASLHLKLLREDQPNAPDLATMHAYALLRSGDIDAAIELLDEHRDDFLAAAVFRYELASQMGDREAKTGSAAQMLELLDRQPRYFEHLDAATFGVAYAEAKASRRFDQAEEIARRWRTRFPDDRKASTALALSLLGRFDRRLPALNRSRFDEPIAVLREAAGLLAGNDAVLLNRSVGELYRQSRADAKLDELWDVLASRRPTERWRTFGL